ncbi:DUF58 domain-containing protein [Alteribacter keqinensis]|uniref:DUF58 domain-containing protein n=1 Tax=Alteribacter keqinensis TaxID=2483800 RepID=A0A3M7TNK7_9BACI|nr:DUF58 domain-containing protein [Alteribacter keqinensis]RNA66706.1 DUF58 domain-containing protein [Alteribacter keqinensis]
MSYVKAVYEAVKRVLKLVLLFAVIAGTFSYAMFQGGFVSWFLFYTVATILTVMLLYLAIPLGGLEMSRSTGQEAAVAGSKLTVDVKIKRKWPFPFLYLVVEDVMDEGLKKQLGNTPKIIYYPTIKKELTFSYTIPKLKRGEYAFYGIRVETSDMFGLFKKERYVKAKGELLVYPDHYHIEGWDAYERHDTETRMSTSDFVEDMTSVAGAREYVPGDKLTSIDWKVSARTNKLMTKEFEEYIGQNFLVLLNEQVSDMKADTLESFEKAVELVTSIVMYSQQKQLDYGLWTMGEGVVRFPLDRGSDHQQVIVHHLAKVKASRYGHFEARLKEADDQIPQGASLIIVTTQITDELLERVNVLTGRRVQVYVCLTVTTSDRSRWEEKRFYELKRQGAVTYMVKEGHFFDSLETDEGERYETIS